MCSFFATATLCLHPTQDFLDIELQEIGVPYNLFSHPLSFFNAEYIRLPQQPMEKFN